MTGLRTASRRLIAGVAAAALAGLPPALAADGTSVANAPPSAAGAPVIQARALIRARSQATLSSEIAGRIVRMAAREGEAFRKGDKLVEFDCAWFAASRDAARATLEYARAKVTSVERLAALRSAGAVDVAQAHADVDKARAELQLASLSVDRCVVLAPFNGRVVELRAHPFEGVGQSTPLLSVLDDTDLEVALVIPAMWLTWLKPGNPFTLTLDETRHGHDGKITRLGAQIDPVSQTVTVYGALADKDRSIVAGMSGTARFIPAGER